MYSHALLHHESWMYLMLEKNAILMQKFAIIADSCIIICIFPHTKSVVVCSIVSAWNCNTTVLCIHHPVKAIMDKDHYIVPTERSSQHCTPCFSTICKTTFHLCDRVLLWLLSMLSKLMVRLLFFLLICGLSKMIHVMILGAACSKNLCNLACWKRVWSSACLSWN